jgi:serine/threonine protein kinase
MERRCGSPGFIAPEVLKRAPYGTQVDCFSIGVVLFQMLTGVPPFRAPTQREVLRQNVLGLTDLQPLAAISACARELVLGLCHTDPNERLTCRAALTSRWITGIAPVVKQPSPLIPPHRGCTSQRAQASQKKGASACDSTRWGRGELYDSVVLPLDCMVQVPRSSLDVEFESSSGPSAGSEDLGSIEFYSGSRGENEGDDLAGITLLSQTPMNVSGTSHLMAFSELSADGKLQFAAEYMGMAKAYFGEDRGRKPPPDVLQDIRQALGVAYAA